MKAYDSAVFDSISLHITMHIQRVRLCKLFGIIADDFDIVVTSPTVL